MGGRKRGKGTSHYEELEKYVKSLSKKELQENLFNALAELEEMKSYR